MADYSITANGDTRPTTPGRPEPVADGLEP